MDELSELARLELEIAFELAAADRHYERARELLARRDALRAAEARTAARELRQARKYLGAGVRVSEAA